MHINSGYFRADGTTCCAVLGIEYENSFSQGFVNHGGVSYPVVFIIFTHSDADNDPSGFHAEGCDSATIYGDVDKIGGVSAAAELFQGRLPTGCTCCQQNIIDGNPNLCPELILEKFGVFFSALFLCGTYQELLDAGHVVQLSGIDEDGNSWSRPSITKCSLETTS
jgi:hypothetical protein